MRQFDQTILQFFLNRLNHCLHHPWVAFRHPAGKIIQLLVVQLQPIAILDEKYQQRRYRNPFIAILEGMIFD